MVKKIIIFGSNFGLNHVLAIKKLKRLFKISVCSPNINKKKINENIEIYNDYKKALKNNFDAAGIVTVPNIQSKICNYIIKNKNKLKYILLEKPIASNFNDTKKIIKGLIKKKIIFSVNFIFVNIPAFKKLFRISKKKKIKNLIYKWTFQQTYFKNKIKTWKINYYQGGGLINYYLIHVFYNLHFFFDQLKIVKIVTFKNNLIITKINLLLVNSNQTRIFVRIDINSIKNEHSIFLTTKNENYNLINISKNWVKNFNLYKNGKKINFINLRFSRENLTSQNYHKLFKTKYLNKQIVKKIIKSHKLCDEIVQKIHI